MNIDNNFLARAGWGIIANGGQALTMQVTSQKDAQGHIGYADVVFNEMILAGMTAVNNDDGLKGISPAISFTARGTDQSLDAVATSKEIFRRFVQKNTIHISKLNIRATSASTLPTSILVLTPNIFTGQMDRQVLNVTADTTMYQQQNNIVTMNNVNLYVGRDSILRFEGAFSEASEVILNIDITIDRYLSIERALVENNRMLTTVSGQVVKAVNEVEQAAAEADPETVTNSAAVQLSRINVGGWIANGGGSTPTVGTKGLDSRGNR